MSVIGANTIAQVTTVTTGGFLTSSFVSPTPVTTTSPTPSTTTITAGDGVQNTAPNLGSSASLYLYTFLATLVLLLGVSSAIVLRSLIIRRRQRRLMEEAIRNGTWVPPVVSRKVDLADKPVMYEVWAQIDQNRRGIEEEKDDWEGIQPFAGAYTKPPMAHNPSTAELGHQTPPPPPTFASRITASLPSRWRRMVSSSSPPLPPPTPNLSTNSPTIPHTPAPPTLSLAELDRHVLREPASLRYAVLIAMPTPNRPNPVPRGCNAPEEELPHLEFGVSETEVKEHDDEAEEEEEEKEGQLRKQSGETE